MNRSALVALLALSVISISVLVISIESPTKHAHIGDKLYESQSDTIDITYQGHLYFTLSINNETGNFIYDTGADHLYFDRDFYDSKSFTHSNIIEMHQPGVGTESKRVEVIRDHIFFQIGQHEFTSTVTPILDLRNILGDFADGIFGKSILKNYTLQVDYIRETAILSQSKEPLHWTDYTGVQLELLDNKMLLPATLLIQDSLRVKGKFLLDFGAGRTVYLTSEIANKFGLENALRNKLLYYSNNGGVGGRSEGHEFLMKSITIGDEMVSNFVGSYSTDKKGALSEAMYIGIIGNGILDRFDLVVDHKENYLYLKPNSMPRDTFDFTYSGFRCINRSRSLGGWLVTGLYSGSNAEASGLEIDDLILELNGNDVKSLDFDKKWEIYNSEETIEVTVDRQGNRQRIDFTIEENNL